MKTIETFMVCLFDISWHIHVFNSVGVWVFNCPIKGGKCIRYTSDLLLCYVCSI